MAETVGLALGVLGIAGLFTSCIENFDIIVRAKDFGEEFDLLCTQLSLQRIRLALWGETLGLLPSPSDQRRQVPYNSAIDREDINPSIVASLCQLRDLLAKADVVTERYALESTPSSTHAYAQEVTRTPKGMLVLRDSFQSFKERIRKNQKQKSVWEVTRWSVHDYAHFEALVDKIRKLLDGLESITNALGLLELQHKRLLEEVESVSDEQSLSLLQDIGSSISAPAAMKAISETASIRLTILSDDSQSYYTARTGQTNQGDGLHVALGLRLKNLTSKLPQREDCPRGNLPQDDNTVSDGQLRASIETGSDVLRDLEFTQNTGKAIIGVSEHRTDGLAALKETPHTTPEDDSSDATMSIPQHQRWMSALLASQTDVEHLPLFSPEDAHYGKAIGPYKASDDQNYRDSSAQLLLQANAGFSLAQRVFIELRNIHRAAVPFISAAPINDALDKILACIEGPPGTPYQGGIFWIAVRISEARPPAMRFQTRIYHPNIDHAGNVCADYTGWWEGAKLLNRKPSHSSTRREMPWFSESATNHYSLGSLLVALCGLLATPNIQDPLVPEIAEKYVTDYDGYCEAARIYAQRYASAPRPAEEEVVFPDEGYAMDQPAHYEAPEFQEKLKTVTSPIEDIDKSSVVGITRNNSTYDDPDMQSELVFNESHRSVDIWRYRPPSLDSHSLSSLPGDKTLDSGIRKLTSIDRNIDSLGTSSHPDYTWLAKEALQPPRPSQPVLPQVTHPQFESLPPDSVSPNPESGPWDYCLFDPLYPFYCDQADKAPIQFMWE